MPIRLQVKRPIRTIRIAGPLGLGLCAVLYLLANISYFAAVNVKDLKASGVTVASYYFLVVFGKRAQRALSVFVALSAYGNVMTVTFSQSRVNQGALPFSSPSLSSSGKAELDSLICRTR